MPPTRTIGPTSMTDHKQSVALPDEPKYANDIATGDFQVYIDPKKESKLLLKFDVCCSRSHLSTFCLLTGVISSSTPLDCSACST